MIFIMFYVNESRLMVLTYAHHLGAVSLYQSKYFLPLWWYISHAE